MHANRLKSTIVGALAARQHLVNQLPRVQWHFIIIYLPVVLQHILHVTLCAGDNSAVFALKEKSFE